jgi:hypothetical protein
MFKKILFTLGLCALAGGVQADFLGTKMSTETISFFIKKPLDSLYGIPRSPDSFHLFTYADNATAATFQTRSTTYPFDDISIDTIKHFTDTMFVFSDVIGDIDGGGGNFTLAIEIQAYYDHIPTTTHMVVQVVSDSLNSGNFASVATLDTVQLYDTRIDSLLAALADASIGDKVWTDASTREVTGGDVTLAPGEYSNIKDTVWQTLFPGSPVAGSFIDSMVLSDEFATVVAPFIVDSIWQADTLNHNAISGSFGEFLYKPQVASVSAADMASIADTVWGADTLAHNATVGSFGEFLYKAASASLTDGDMGAIADSVWDKAKADAYAVSGGMGDMVQDTLNSILADVVNVDGIVPSTAGDAMTLTTGERAAVADTVWGADTLNHNLTVGSYGDFLYKDVNVASMDANTITATVIATNAIGELEIAADAITSDEIATDAIGALEIATDAIGALEIATNAITSGELADDAITSDKFTAAALDSMQFTDSMRVAERAAITDSVWGADTLNHNIPVGSYGEFLYKAQVASVSDADMAAIADSVWQADTLTHNSIVGSYGDFLYKAASASLTDGDMGAIADSVWDKTRADGYNVADGMGDFLRDTANSILAEVVGVNGLTPSVAGDAMTLTAAGVDLIWNEDTTGHKTDPNMGYWITQGGAAAISTSDMQDIADSVWSHVDTAWASTTIGDQLLDQSDTNALVLAEVIGVNGLTPIVITDSVLIANRTEIAMQISDTVWDELITGSVHSVATSAGKRLRLIDAAFDITSGLAQSPFTSTTIKLESGNPDGGVNEIYAGDRVSIIGGTGVSEHGIVVSYDASTDIATMSQAWVTTPDATSEYELSPADVDVETWQHVVVTNSATTNFPVVDVGSISDDAAAANNAELDYDGTGLARANSTIGTATAVTNDVTLDDGEFALIGDSVWNVDTLGHNAVVGSYGEFLYKAQVASLTDADMAAIADSVWQTDTLLHNSIVGSYGEFLYKAQSASLTDGDMGAIADSVWDKAKADGYAVSGGMGDLVQDTLNSILAEVVNIDAWNPITDNDSLIVDQSSLEDIAINLDNVTGSLDSNDFEDSTFTGLIHGTSFWSEFASAAVLADSFWQADTLNHNAITGSFGEFLYKAQVATVSDADMAAIADSVWQADSANHDGVTGSMGELQKWAHYNNDSLQNFPARVDLIWDEDTTGHKTADQMGYWITQGGAASISTSDMQDIADSVWSHIDTAWATTTMGDQVLDHSDTLKILIDSINTRELMAAYIADSVWQADTATHDGVAGSFGASTTLGNYATAGSVADSVWDKDTTDAFAIAAGIGQFVKDSAAQTAAGSVTAQNMADISDSVWSHIDTAWLAESMGNQLTDHTDSINALLDTLQDGAQGPDVNVASMDVNTVTATAIAPNAITSSELADNAITADKIATDAIGALEIAADAIGASELATNAITSAELADDALTLGKFTTAASDSLRDVKSISEDATAAINLETMLDGTGGQELSLGKLDISGSDATASVEIVNTASGGGGVSIASTSGDAVGLYVKGFGSGAGAWIDGGATGAGIFISGGATSGDAISTSVTSGNELDASLRAEIVDDVWDEDTLGHKTADQMGYWITQGGGAGGPTLVQIVDGVWDKTADSAFTAGSMGDSAKGWGQTGAGLTGGSLTAALGVVDTASGGGGADDTLVSGVSVDFFTAAGTFLGRELTNSDGYIPLALDAGTYLVRVPRVNTQDHIFPLNTLNFDTLVITNNGDTFPSSLTEVDSLNVDSAITGYDLALTLSGTANTCQVYGDLADITGETGYDLLGGIPLTFTMPQGVNDTCSNLILLTRTRTVTTDATGRFTVDLTYSSCMEETDYILTITHPAFYGQTIRVTVPDSVSYLLNPNDF